VEAQTTKDKSHGLETMCRNPLLLVRHTLYNNKAGHPISAYTRRLPYEEEQADPIHIFHEAVSRQLEAEDLFKWLELLRIVLLLYNLLINLIRERLKTLCKGYASEEPQELFRKIGPLRTRYVP